MRAVIPLLIVLLVAGALFLTYSKSSSTNDDDKDLNFSLEVENIVNEILEKVKNDRDESDNAQKELVWVGQSAVPYLKRALKSDDKAVVIVAARALRDIDGDESLKDIVQAYVKSKNTTQIHLGQIIQTYDKKALPYLYKELTNEDDLTRYWVVDLIAHIGLEESLDVLKKRYEVETSDKVKLQIIRAIYRKDTENQKEYLEFVHKMLETNDEFTKCAAIFLISELKDESKVEFLKKCFTDESANIRMFAIISIVNFDRDDYIPDLIKLISHEDVNTSCTVIRELGYKSNLSQEFKEDIKKALIKALASKEMRVRYAAVSALADYDDLNIIPHLEQIAENDSDEKVRARAKNAIVEVKTNNANKTQTKPR